MRNTRASRISRLLALPLAAGLALLASAPQAGASEHAFNPYQLGDNSRGNAQVVEAIVPLANMFGYVNQLRSFTQGRAQYTMQFSHYEEVPSNVAEEVKAKLG